MLVQAVNMISSPELRNASTLGGDLLQEVYGLIVALSRERPEVSVRALLPLCRRGVSEMPLVACARLLEKAGYIERVSVYDNADDLSSSTQIVFPTMA